VGLRHNSEMSENSVGVFWKGLSHKKGTQKEVGSCSLDVVHIRVTSKLLQLFCQGGQPLDESN
jgi:hypothetical protein